MAAVIATTELANWPGVVLRTTTTNTFVVDLVNGLIVDIIGDRATYPNWVRALAFKAAARALANPENFSSVTRQIDDWKTTVRYRDSDDGFDPDDVGVYLTDAEETRLRRLVTSKKTTGIGSFGLRVPG